MRIGIIGSGGREAALAWKCRQSLVVEQVFVLPGNTAIEDSYPSVNPLDFEALEAFCRLQDITLLIVGAEQSLVAGITNYFANTDIQVFGPKAEAARLEGSKLFSKAFMQKYGIRTAASHTVQTLEEAQVLIPVYQGQMVFKYDGLAAGKGVFVCHNVQEAQTALAEMQTLYGSKFNFLIEELLIGDEVSIMGLLDGQHIALLLPTQDHKQLLDNDQGPNTGGMGAFGPLPWLDETLMQAIQSDLIDPTLKGLQSEGFDYKGFLYFGVMVTAKGPYLLEYNVRLGDPETQALMFALDADLVELVNLCLKGGLGKNQILAAKKGYVLNLVLAAEGYPQKPKKGMLIEGLDTLGLGVHIFPAGMGKDTSGSLRVEGGRVLGIVAQASSLEDARQQAYEAANKISFSGKQFRTDIAKRTWHYPFKN